MDKVYFNPLSQDYLRGVQGCRLGSIFRVSLKYVQEKELYDNIEDFNERGLDFVLSKVEFIQKLNLTLLDAAKVDIILVPMLDKFEVEHLEVNNLTFS